MSRGIRPPLTDRSFKNPNPWLRRCAHCGRHFAETAYTYYDYENDRETHPVCPITLRFLGNYTAEQKSDLLRLN